MKAKIFFAMVLLTLSAGCSDWLDVTPKTEMKSDELFASEEGFISALTGVYTLMEASGLYGQELTFNFMEKLVMRYDNYENNPSKKELAEIYDYKNQSGSIQMLSSVWANMYNIIANVNNLLYRLETNGEVVKTPGYYEVMKGEALGLRAFLYFDLLRMWGPVYQKDSMALAIPYRSLFSSEKMPLVAAYEVMQHITDDLVAAKELLKDDPLVFTMNAKDSFLGYRRNRMNLIAVKALLARVYLWRGNKADAAKYAREIIENPAWALNIENTKDVSMYNETLFALDVNDMENRYSTFFPSTSTSWTTGQLWIKTSTLDELYETTTIGINDIRGKQDNGFVFGDDKRLSRKYMSSSDKSYSGHIPLIRLSEIYYIMAEAVALEKSGEYINAVRNARGIGVAYNVGGKAFTEEARIEELRKEYDKEFFGEGQYFYFLKRHNLKTFPRSVVSEMYNYYVFPLPDAEVEHGLAAE